MGVDDRQAPTTCIQSGGRQGGRCALGGRASVCVPAGQEPDNGDRTAEEAAGADVHPPASRSHVKGTSASHSKDSHGAWSAGRERGPAGQCSVLLYSVGRAERVLGPNVHAVGAPPPEALPSQMLSTCHWQLRDAAPSQLASVHQ